MEIGRYQFNLLGLKRHLPMTAIIPLWGNLFTTCNTSLLTKRKLTKKQRKYAASVLAN